VILDNFKPDLDYGEKISWKLCRFKKS